MKIGQLYRVVEDKGHGGGVALKSVDEEEGLVVLKLPANLKMVLLAQAVLHDMTLEKNCIDQLNKTVESWLESDWPQETFEKAYKPEKEEDKQEDEPVSGGGKL